MADDDKRTEAQKKTDKEDWRWRRFVWMPGDLHEVNPNGSPIDKKKGEPKLEVSEKKKKHENDDGTTEPV